MGFWFYFACIQTAVMFRMKLNRHICLGWGDIKDRCIFDSSFKYSQRLFDIRVYSKWDQWSQYIIIADAITLTLEWKNKCCIQSIYMSSKHIGYIHARADTIVYLQICSCLHLYRTDNCQYFPIPESSIMLELGVYYWVEITNIPVDLDYLLQMWTLGCL